MSDIWTDLGNSEFRLADGQILNSRTGQIKSHRPIWVLHHTYGKRPKHPTAFQLDTTQQDMLTLALTKVVGSELNIQCQAHPTIKSRVQVIIVPPREGDLTDQLIEQIDQLNTWLVTSYLNRLALQQRQ